MKFEIKTIREWMLCKEKRGAKAVVRLVLRFFMRLAAGAGIGALLGLVGVAFHYAVDYAQALRVAHPLFLYLLPVTGLVIVLAYRLAGVKNDPGADAVLQSALSGEPVSGKMAPLIFLSTALTHLSGGSAGREGAALQLGGSVAGFFSRMLRANRAETRVFTVCGMSAAFSALFGTPVTAAVFAIGVSAAGGAQYAALMPSVVSALAGCYIARLCGVPPTRFALAAIQLTPASFLSVTALSVACGLLSFFFCKAMTFTSGIAAKRIPNPYLRILAGGALVLAFTLLSGTRDYNGAGMDVIARAIAGGARPWDFAVKLLLTVVTLCAGYRGGAIVPAFFIGATFGAAFGPLFGLDPCFAAGVGLVCMFCGVTNCALTAVLLSVELFGGDGLALFALAVAVSYLASGNASLYRAQRVLLSKWDVEASPASALCADSQASGAPGEDAPPMR